MRRFARVLALVAMLAFLTTACASDKNTGLPEGPTEAPSTAVCTGQIQMNDELKFVPENCTIKAGTTVTWTTVGAVPHTSTSEPTAPVTFDSDQVVSGGKFEFTFATAGTVVYYCRLHSSPGTRVGMIGTIVVEAA